MQCICNTRVDAGWRRAWVNSRGKTILNAEVDSVRAEGTFLCHAEACRVGSFDLVLHGWAVGEMRLMDEKTRLIGASDLAIGTADAQSVVDRHDSVRALACRRRRADMHARGIGAVLASDRNEHATD